MADEMKAMVWTNYGPPDVLQCQTVKKPVPKDHEVLIRIRAATVTAGDCELRGFYVAAWLKLPLRLYMGVLKPRIKILGQELSGEIESIGKAVTLFKIGDRVFTPTTMSMGAYAEYICLPEKYAMGIKPINMSYEEAATLSVGGINSLHFIKQAAIKPGEKVLINGAGGCIGTYAVQLSKSLGAEVTAVDSAMKLDMLSSIGADHVIDYTKEDFTKTDKTYDVIIDIVGKSKLSRGARLLKLNGRYILGNPKPSDLFWKLLLSRTQRKVIIALAAYRPEDMIYLRALAEAGKIKAVIDKQYPLEQVAEAHRYVEQGNKTGNVVITV